MRKPKRLGLTSTHPHVYGELNTDAVVRTFDFNEFQGGFVLPTEALELVVQRHSQEPNGPLYKLSKLPPMSLSSLVPSSITCLKCGLRYIEAITSQIETGLIANTGGLTTKKTRKQRRKLRILPIYAIVEKVKSAYEIRIYETASGNEPFNDWLDSLDNSVKGKVIARVDRLKKGLFGNAKALKNGLYELKFKNPVFRIYYAIVGKQVILLVSGGDKNQQSKDIKEAKEYLEDYRSRYESEEKS